MSTLHSDLNKYVTFFFCYFQVQHYILVVQAQDAGHPALSSTLTVYCNVLDLNDNAPLFDPMSYSNEIFENVSVATPVVTVSATDLDSGKSELKPSIFWVTYYFLHFVIQRVQKVLMSCNFERNNTLYKNFF